MTVLEIQKTPEITLQYREKYIAPNYLIDKIDLEFDVQDKFTVVSSSMHVKLNTKNENAPLILDGENLNLLEVKINGEKLSEDTFFVRQWTEDPNNVNENTVIGQQLVIEKVPNDFTLETKVKINPSNNKTCMGLYESNGILSTQCESEGFRKITFFVDRPDNRAMFSTKIIADKRKYPVLLSNGDLQESGNFDDKRHYATWVDPHVKPSYLFALVAGNLQSLEDNFVTKSNEIIKLKIYVPEQDIDKISFAMKALKGSMKFDEDAYNREYDLGVYNIVGVPDFNMGAMENKGLNIFNSSTLLAKPETATDNNYKYILSVVSHEYFHNWAGNRVGPLSWFELSLKEGLATSKEREFAQFSANSVVPRIEDVNTLQIVQFAQDEGPMAQPVRLESIQTPDNIYTTTTYYKGAELLHMLYVILGEKTYRESVSHYFDKYDGQAVTINEFLKSLEEVSGRDLSQFLLWYHQSGTPILDFEEDYDEKSKAYKLTITQTTNPTKDQSVKQNLLIPITISLIGKNGKEIDLNGQKEVTLELTEKQQTFEFNNIKEKPTLSMLRNFSAPVKIGKSPLTDKDLMFLAENDTDGFNQWNSFRKMMLKEFRNILNDKEISQDFLNVCKSILMNKKIADELKAIMLSPMGFNDFLGQEQNVDPEKIGNTSDRLNLEIANACEKEFDKIRAKLNKEITDGSFSYELAAKRRLRNICLCYIGYLKSDEALKILQKQLSISANMTDTLGALSAIVGNFAKNKPEVVEKLLNDFYEKWQNEYLVILKWISLLNCANFDNKADYIKSIMSHKAFDIKNPNQVRTLVGGFANSREFHDKSGKGYKLLLDVVLTTDKFNPMLSGSLMTPLTKWEKFISPYQDLMKETLRNLSGKVSTNVQEFVDKSLPDEINAKKN